MQYFVKSILFYVLFTVKQRYRPHSTTRCTFRPRSHLIKATLRCMNCMYMVDTGKSLPQGFLQLSSKGLASWNLAFSVKCAELCVCVCAYACSTPKKPAQDLCPPCFLPSPFLCGFFVPSTR